MLSRALVPLFVGVMVLAIPIDAWAYLDIGTGSYLFQLAIAGFFASMMTIKIYYQRVKAWLYTRRTPPPDPTLTSPTPTSSSTGSTST